MGLDFLLKVLERVDVEEMVVNKGLCPNVRVRKICDICKRHCPTKAIKVSNNIELNRERCIGCGICSTVCPNGVFEMATKPDVRILAEIKDGLKADNSLTFICDKCSGVTGSIKRPRRGKDPRRDGTPIQVPCFGRINFVFLLYAWTKGAETVKFAKEHCDETCICHSNTIRVQRRNIEIANHFLRAMGDRKKIRSKKKGQKEDEVIKVSSKIDAPTRREIISRGVRTGVIEAINFVIPFDIGLDSEPNKKRKKEKYLAQSIPTERQYLLQILRKNRPGDHLVRLNQNKRLPFPFLDVRIKEGACDGCSTCITVCPTGALGKIERNDSNVIYFDFGKCTGCRLCKETCPEDAIWFNNILNLKRVNERGKELVELVVGVCDDCGMRFIKRKEDDKCPNCSKREMITQGFIDGLKN